MPIADRAVRPNDVRSLEADAAAWSGAVLLLVSLFLERYQPGIDAWEIFEVGTSCSPASRSARSSRRRAASASASVRPPSWTFGPAIAALVIVVYAFLDPRR